MYTDDQEEVEEEEVVEVVEKIVKTKSSENVVFEKSLHEDTFKRERKLSRQFSDDFIDMFKVGANVYKSAEVFEKSNENEKQDSSETSSPSENMYVVNPETRMKTSEEEELVRPAKPGLSHLVPSLATNCPEEEEEGDDLFLSAEDLLVQALCLNGSKKIIGEEEEEEHGEDRISKYRVCERISEASEDSSLELVIPAPEHEAKDLLVFSDIFTSRKREQNNVAGAMGDDESRKESTSSILPDIRDIQSQIGDINEEKGEKRVKEIDLLDEDTMTSVEINQLFDDELKQVGEIKQGLSKLSHTLVCERQEQEEQRQEQEEEQQQQEEEQEKQEVEAGEKLLKGRSLRHLLCSLGTRSTSLEEVFPAAELLLRRTTSEPLLELIEESEEEKIGLKHRCLADGVECNREQSRKCETNNNQLKEDLQHQHESLEDKMNEEEEEEEEEEEGIRPILKKRTRLSVSESGSQTEITALDHERQERHRVGHCINYFLSLNAGFLRSDAFAGRKIPVRPNAQ